MNTLPKISVVLVDDSSVIRAALSRILQTDSGIEVIGSVVNGEMAVSIAKSKKPNIIILDVEMPVMDGLTALPQILQHSPDTKVIMCSSLTAKGGDITIKAMALGAVECLVKPSSAQETGPGSAFQTTLINLVKTLGGTRHATKELTQPPSSSATPSRLSHADISAVAQKRNQGTIILRNDPSDYSGVPKILAIGSSTGGPQALFKVVEDLGTLEIPVVITQHMPETFTKILADHLQQKCGVQSHEGADGMPVENGHYYIAPGGKHMLFKERNGQLFIKLNDGPEENFCKPAVDPMMRSLIEIYGEKILCAILTGMGQDGLLGARALVENNGRVIAQDEASSVVWGMPGAVATDGICSAVMPLNDIGGWLKRAVS